MSKQKEELTWIGAFRYYLNINNIAAIYFIDGFRNHLPNLSQEAKELVLKDLTVAQQDGKLGVNKESWLTVQQLLRESLGELNGSDTEGTSGRGGV